MKSRLTLAIAILMYQMTASAHPGHGEPGTFLHDLTHAAWYVAAAIIMTLALPRAYRLVQSAISRRKRH